MITLQVDIHIGFFKRQHRIPSGHSCERFDGGSGVLAHAIPPSHNMFLHFDEDERWTVGSNARSGKTYSILLRNETNPYSGLR